MCYFIGLFIVYCFCSNTRTVVAVVCSARGYRSRFSLGKKCITTRCAVSVLAFEAAGCSDSERHGVLGDGKYRSDPRHERKEFLPLVLGVLPFLRDDLRGTDVDEGAGHDGEHDGVDDRRGEFVDEHTEGDADRSHGAEDRQKRDYLSLGHPRFQKCDQEGDRFGGLRHRYEKREAGKKKVG